MTDSHLPPPDCCAECASRRDFVRSTAWLVAALAAGPLPIRFGRALRALGDEAVYALPTEDGVLIDRERAVILARFRSRVYAFVLWCPHQRTALRWQEEAGRFECPKHHSKYQPTGQFIEGRATLGMDRYALRRQGDTVVVDLGTVSQQDKDSTTWAAAVLEL